MKLLYRLIQNKIIILFILLSFLFGLTVGYLLNFNQKKGSNLHYSFFNQKDFFEEAFMGTKKLGVEGDKNIKSLVVPHHLLASKIIAKTFSAVSSKEPITIVLISPNHFFIGKGKIISSVYDWKTPYGILESEKEIIKKLQKKEIITIEEGPFRKEHGISSLVSFIKKSFPNAKFIPLIFKETAAEKKCYELVHFLKKESPDFLVIASLDFSHYVSSKKADINDKKSLNVLRSFNYKKIDSLNIDSKPVFRVFLKYSELQNAKNFSIINHSNSAKILKDENILETTSYISGYFYIDN